MRIIIFGLGEIGKKWIPQAIQYCHETDIQIVAFSDNDIEKCCHNDWGKIPIILPDKIQNERFDKVFLFLGKKAFEEVHRQFTAELRIPEEKIDNLIGFISEMQKRKGMGRNLIQKRKRMIYDCFPFFNEFDILDIRLSILAPYVDRFVIVELDKTHRGIPKEYNFLKKKERYKRYEEKITYLQPKDIPNYNGANDWSIENYQRNCIVRGLTDCEPEDIIGISDCDEVPNPYIYKCLRERKQNDRYKDDLEEKLNKYAMALEQDFCYYFFNCRHKVKWNGSVIVKYQNLLEPQVYRELRNSLPSVRSGGWHFSYFGSVDNNKKKTESIVDGIETNEEAIRKRIESGVDIYGRQGEQFELEFVAAREMQIPKIESLIERYPQYYKKIKEE